MTVQLYDDQRDLVTRVRQAMRRHKAVLMQSPTGSGKTQMAADMIAGTRAKGTRSIFLVPRRELLRQTIETMQDHDAPFGVIAAGFTPNPFAKTQLATTGTLGKRLDKTTPPHVLFVDEAHFGGDELDRIIKWAKAAGGWVVGLSATPTKLSGKGMGEWYDHMEQGLPLADLIRLGRLSGYRLFAPSKPDLSGIKTVAGDYAKGELAGMMEGDRVLIGNAVRHYREHAMGRLNVAFCVSRKHAEITAQSFRDQGVPAASIDGTMDDEERSRIIRRFARREILVLCNCELLTFGFDLAAAAKMNVTVEAMSDLRPTKSLALQMQKWGRVLRMKPEPALIFDHAGNVERHGMPDDPREWTLAGSEKRGGGGEKTLPVRQCPECYWVSRPTPVCPNCGFVHPVQARAIDEVEGDLAEITSRPKPSVEQAIVASWEGLDGLIRLGRSRGYPQPELWAAKVMSARLAKRRA